MKLFPDVIKALEDVAAGRSLHAYSPAKAQAKRALRVLKKVQKAENEGKKVVVKLNPKRKK